jgi:hypothetical protein
LPRASAIAVLLLLALVLAGAAARAQAPASAVSADAAVAEMSSSYTLPTDWTLVTVKALPKPPADTPGHPSPDPTQPSQTTPRPVADELPIKGTACIRVPLTAKHGNPTSVIVAVELPFDCYGQPMGEQDLANFGSGAAQGFKQNFDLIDPVFGLYSLGTHQFWIERAKGSIKGSGGSQPPSEYTLEIACTMLKKGAACWMTMAADAACLHVFEDAYVKLDDDASTPLVPANAFEKPPS